MRLAYHLEANLNARHYLKFVACLCCFVLPGVSAQAPVQAVPKPTTKASISTISQDEIDHKVSSLVDEQLKAKLDPKIANSQLVVEQAQRSVSEVHEQITLIVHLMEWFLGVVSLVAAVLIAFGGLEWYRTKNLRGQAESLVNEAKAAIGLAVDGAEKASKHIQEIRLGLTEAWRFIDENFAFLPGIQAYGVVRASGPPGASSFPQEDRVLWEDKDAIVVVCDQLGIASDAQKKSQHFIKLAGYWRSVRNFPKAWVRANRAVELTPNNADAHFTVGKTLAYWAAHDKADAGGRATRLQEARDQIKVAQTIEGKTGRIFHMLGWICDEDGDFTKAIDLYTQALSLDAGDPRCMYDLICALAKAKRYDEASEMFGKLSVRDAEMSENARTDEDLAEFRETQQWKITLQRAGR